MNQMPFLVNLFWPNTPSLEIEKANINWAKFLSKIHFALLEVYPMIVCLATVTPAYNLSKYSWVVVVGNSMNCVHFCNNNSKPTVQRICLWPRLWPMHIVHWALCIGQCAQLPMDKVYCYTMYPVVTRAQEKLPRENQSRQHPAGYLSLGWAIFYHLYFSVKCSCLKAGHLIVLTRSLAKAVPHFTICTICTSLVAPGYHILRYRLHLTVVMCSKLPVPNLASQPFTLSWFMFI